MLNSILSLCLIHNSCHFLVHNLTVLIPLIGGVLFVFVVIALLQTSFTDPGILPRALPDEAVDIERQIGEILFVVFILHFNIFVLYVDIKVVSLFKDNSGSSTYRPPPRTKEIIINDQVVKLKYCFTCKMFRPPRTSHCSLCDNCVGKAASLYSAKVLIIYSPSCHSKLV